MVPILLPNDDERALGFDVFLSTANNAQRSSQPFPNFDEFVSSSCI